ncbi:uncharacterized protein ASPGLDRAFT_1029340 [Aspergillus glaucus CBS 516.65]|uniref:Uncharacterized protein n=1 Tax=Aspergillus glaucus CBS 516.65 TaxID=1160497 RepID=A0A1L9VW19_ASPGL|nr:hypothetical protein ASPGLDRAFT_1029340 [Aspergillus glaucus CBS 516.65]OJJ88104.1 hypothetical protein ASPGLDRAFT_1029340 [Aspergillus glaucus CBS 516.65]
MAYLSCLHPMVSMAYPSCLQSCTISSIHNTIYCQCSSIPIIQELEDLFFALLISCHPPGMLSLVQRSLAQTTHAVLSSSAIPASTAYVPYPSSMPFSTNSPYLPQRSCLAVWTFAVHSGPDSYSADLQSLSFFSRPPWCHHPDQSYQGSILLALCSCLLHPKHLTLFSWASEALSITALSYA